MDLPKDVQDKMVAGMDMIRRTGAENMQLRFQDDPEPTVWFCTAEYKGTNGKNIHEAAGAMDPMNAILRLCDTLVDGALCVHCKRPTGFEPHDVNPMPADELFCWYQYDPELKKYRRGCEGDDK